MKDSVVVKSQWREFRGEGRDGDGKPVVVVAVVRHDDQCGNGHNSFSITGTVYGVWAGRRDGTERNSSGRVLSCVGCGCVHDEIARYIPELAPFLKWHLTSTDGPMHYIANTVYLAGDRDHWGLRKGEFRQHTSRGAYQAGGVAGVPCWELEIPEDKQTYSVEQPKDAVLRWVPVGMTGKGKAREFDAARRAAVWPEATDEQLSAEPAELRAMLKARLPKLMEEFRAAVESLGLVY